MKMVSTHADENGVFNVFWWHFSDRRRLQRKLGSNSWGFFFIQIVERQKKAEKKAFKKGEREKYKLCSIHK